VSILPPALPPGPSARALRLRECPLQPPAADWYERDARLDPQHPARVFLRALYDLDPAPWFAVYSGRGSAASPPCRLLAAVLYELHVGQRSPAPWFRHARESDPLRWLWGGPTPSRTAWYDFRDRLADSVLPLVQGLVRHAIAAGFTPAHRAASAGTLVAANASRHHLQSQQTLAQHLDQLDQATAAAAAPTPRPGWRAPTATGRHQQLQRYRQAQETMDARQQRHGRKHAGKRTAVEKLRVSVGAPQAAVGRDKEKVYRPLYNVQLRADLEAPFILA